MARIGFDGRFVNDQYHGIGRMAYDLIDQMSQQHPEVAFVVLYDPSLKNTRFDMQKVLARPNVEPVVTDIKFFSMKEQFLLPGIMGFKKIDVWYSPFFLFPVGIPCKAVITVCDLIFDRMPFYLPSKREFWVYKLFMGLGTWRAKKIVVISEATAVDLQKFYKVPKNKIKVMYLGGDPHYKPVKDTQRQAEVRQKYNLPERFILTVGTRRPHKNVTRLVEAFAQVAAEEDINLVLTGPFDKRFKDEPMAKAAELNVLDRIVTPGYVAEEDLPAIYSMAEVFVFPSLVEGFGLTLLEAMACGVPVVTSNISSMPEVVGAAAIKIDPYNVSEMANAILLLLQNPTERERYCQLGLAREANFTWEASAKRAWEIIQEAL
ncbi:MAG: glycosyltransferase family 1 protein [Candidatus Promineifilaceae bacterium]